MPTGVVQNLKGDELHVAKTLDSDTDQEDENDVDMGEVEVPAGPLYTPGMFGKFAFAFSTYIPFLLELGCHYYNSLPI